MRAIFTFLIGILALTACDAENAADQSYLQIIQERQEDGWQMHEVLGVKGKGVYTTFMLSETASAIRAYWVESGERNVKRYQQDEWVYLVLTFQKNNGDTYAAVMKKAKKGVRR